LLQIRSIGPLGSFLSRAYVYPSNADSRFIQELLAELRRKRVCFARIGNTMCGPEEEAALAAPGVKAVERHTFILNLEPDEEALFKKMDRAVRNKIRKMEKENVRTFEAAGADELDEYWRLSKVTSDRIRASGSIMELPREFFAEVFDRMIKARRARLILAKHGEDLLAGLLCFMFGDVVLAYQAASTRDRRLTGMHGPTACFWTAIRAARADGFKVFDLGGCTPNLPTSDSRHGVYFFKSQWGGELKKFYNGEAVLSHFGYRIQEDILGKVWDAAHPYYFAAKRLLGRAG